MRDREELPQSWTKRRLPWLLTHAGLRSLWLSARHDVLHRTAGNLRKRLIPKVVTTKRDLALGVVDFIRFPALGSGWGGPFNGQPFRQALFRELINRLKPAAIVETGTYLGTTTAFMAETGLPVFTIEGNPRNYGFAKARLWRQRNVTIRQGDSRAVIRRLFEGPLRPLGQRILFAYLDAHWHANLPLAEELEIILSRCPAAILMIDDFQVPFDAGYEYDDYGAGKALTPTYIARVVAAHDVELFYPSTPSSEEGGMRRGCVILAKAAFHSSTLASLPLLRRGIGLKVSA